MSCECDGEIRKIRPIPLYTYLVGGLTISADGETCHAATPSLQSVGFGPQYTASYTVPFEGASYSGIHIAVYEGPIETGRKLSEAYSVSLDSQDSTSITIHDIGLFIQEPENWISACPTPVPPPAPWCGNFVPESLSITLSGFSGGPCVLEDDNEYRKWIIESGINGTFEATSITPLEGGWTATFDLGHMEQHQYELGGCINDEGVYADAGVSATITFFFPDSYSISFGNGGVVEPNPIAHGEGSCPFSTPAIINDNDIFWSVGSINITL